MHLTPWTVVASTKSDPGFKCRFSAWSWSGCPPDRSWNAVDSFPYRRVSWKAVGNCMRDANKPYRAENFFVWFYVQRGGSAWAGCGPAQSPPRCTKCNSPPIDSQWCTKSDVPTLRYSMWHSKRLLKIHLHILQPMWTLITHRWRRVLFAMHIILATSTTVADRASTQRRTSSLAPVLRDYASTSGNVRQPPTRTSTVKRRSLLYDSLKQET